MTPDNPFDLRNSTKRLIATLALGVASCSSNSPNGVPIPMVPARWDLTGEADFGGHAANGTSALRIRHGSAILKGTTFRDGTIDFDIGLKGGGVVGITFRQQNKSNAEVFYLRPQNGCARSDDCIQYMPLSHGAFEWDLYPQYQTRAPVRASGWNHVRMVVSDHRMNVFINGASQPTLSVGRLAGGEDSGAIAFHGPADFANLVIAAGKTGGLPNDAQRGPQDGDARYLRDWQVSPAKTLTTAPNAGLQVNTGRTPLYGEMSAIAAGWRQVQAEPDGLVNLSRAVGSSDVKTNVSVAWLKTQVDSDRDQTRVVSFGWIREAWVYLNGRPIFQGRNFYGVPGASKEPDGRLSLRNGVIRLPLHKGRNEIAVALSDNFGGNPQHFGWGMKMKWADRPSLKAGAVTR